MQEERQGAIKNIRKFERGKHSENLNSKKGGLLFIFNQACAMSMPFNYTGAMLCAAEMHLKHFSEIIGHIKKEMGRWDELKKDLAEWEEHVLPEAREEFQRLSRRFALGGWVPPRPDEKEHSSLDDDGDDGKDGNIAQIRAVAKDFDAIRQSFKGVAKDLEAEQEAHVRGDQHLGYDQL